MVLADEPTGNLDTKTGNEVFDLLKYFRVKFRRDIIFHNQELAKKTDGTICIKDGLIEKEVLN